ncbi:MAG: DNA polymerase III subunit delta [Methylocystaceae bacterium]
MFRLIAGTEDYLLDRRIDELLRQMEQETGEVETVVVSSEDITAEQLLELLDFSPLFAAARFVVLKKLPLWDEGGRRSGLVNQVKDSLISYIQAPPEGQWVAATTNKTSVQNPLVAELKKFSALEEIKTPSSGQRLAIIRQEAEYRGLNIGEPELKMLSESGQDLYFICTLFDKWSLIPELKINRKVLLAEGIGADSEGAIFAFSDALILGETPKAMVELQRLQEAGEPALRILATVNRQLMTLVKVKGWSQEGRNAAEIAADIGDKKGYRSKRLLQDAAKVDWHRLRMVSKLICDTDTAIKTSRFPEGMALEYLALSATKQK